MLCCWRLNAHHYLSVPLLYHRSLASVTPLCLFVCDFFGRNFHSWWYRFGQNAIWAFSHSDDVTTCRPSANELSNLSRCCLKLLSERGGERQREQCRQDSKISALYLVYYFLPYWNGAKLNIAETNANLKLFQTRSKLLQVPAVAHLQKAPFVQRCMRALWVCVGYRVFFLFGFYCKIRFCSSIRRFGYKGIQGWCLTTIPYDVFPTCAWNYVFRGPRILGDFHLACPKIFAFRI